MSNVQKANALPTFWVGKSPKYGIERRVKMMAGYTDEELKQTMETVLKNADLKEDKRRAEEAYKLTDEYPKSKLQFYKQKELNELAKRVDDMSNANNSRFMGGYTPPAVIQHKYEVERIKAYEQSCRLEIEDRYNGSKECLERVRKLMLEDERDSNYKHLYNGSGNLNPRVGGYGGRHAAAHGGGFNHRGVYAGGVWN